MKIMAPGPTTSWEIDGETVSDFIFLGSKITTDSDCSHEIKRCCSLEEKLPTLQADSLTLSLQRSREETQGLHKGAERSLRIIKPGVAPVQSVMPWARSAWEHGRVFLHRGCC